MKIEAINIGDLKSRYRSFLELSNVDKGYIFPVASSDDEDLFLMILFALENDASDLHISSTPSRRCFVNIECGQVMHKYALKLTPKYIREKLIGLLGIPADFGNKTAISSSFMIELHPNWARDLQLPVDPNEVVYQIAVRVQITKTNGRESVGIVLRFLDAHKLKSLDESFKSGAILSLLKDRTQIRKTGGLVLMSGPTGSGKTSTLYMLLNRLNDGANAIFTIEKPIEYPLPGNGPIYQTEVTQDFSFSQAIRSAAVRMRPKVILVGEINDVETALAALEAAMTGHLVFATIHANTAIETLVRFINLLVGGGMSFETARQQSLDILKMVVAQRLVSDYGPCDIQRKVTPDEIDWMRKNDIPTTSWVPDTRNLQRNGAIIIPEIIDFTYEIKHAFSAGEDSIDNALIYQALTSQCTFEPLAQCVWKYIEEGRVDIEEAILASGHNFYSGLSDTVRKRIAQKYDTSFMRASAIIDSYYSDRNEGRVDFNSIDIFEYANRIMLNAPTGNMPELEREAISL